MTTRTELARDYLNERSRVSIGREIATVERVHATTGSTPEQVVSAARPLRSWLADTEMLCPPATVIPHLAVQGRVTLLSGREKIGKSTLVAGAVAAASRRDDVLGVPVSQPVHTLWYALDEHVADAVRRFEGLGATPDHVIINTSPRTDTELLSALELDLATFPGIGLVVVDTLSRVFAASGVDPNSSRDVEPVIARLIDLFHRHNVAAILLYHTGKAGREYRGSTAIGATVDDILTLRRRGQTDEDDFDDDTQDDGRRLLVQDGRNLRGRLQLTCADGRYRLYDDAWPPRIRLLEALRDHGTVASRGELVKLASVRKASGLRTIGELIGEGAIIEKQRGLTLGLNGAAELGSQALSIPAAVPNREPDRHRPEFRSSERFPEEGTTPEPRREPSSVLAVPDGSGFGHPHPARTGTGANAEPELQVRL